MKAASVGICLLAMLIPFSLLSAAEQSDNGNNKQLVVLFTPSSSNAAVQSIRGAESSPFIVGAWKLVCSDNGCLNPVVDTEFRFINPTTLTVTLEYAFFENDGTFCGCDRDTLKPNQTTVYTASAERNNRPSLMQCKGNSGALKSIVFITQGSDHSDSGISIDKATQTGFQTHLFGNITASSDGMTSYANTMGEAGMKGIEITEETLKEIKAIHDACVSFAPVGPLK